jgi:hypothetical protein
MGLHKIIQFEFYATINLRDVPLFMGQRVQLKRALQSVLGMQSEFEGTQGRQKENQ